MYGLLGYGWQNLGKRKVNDGRWMLVHMGRQTGKGNQSREEGRRVDMFVDMRVDMRMEDSS